MRDGKPFDVILVHCQLKIPATLVASREQYHFHKTSNSLHIEPRTNNIAMTSTEKRTVLVTGGTGLLGRQVVNAFRMRSWNVVGTGYSRADGVATRKVDLGDASDVKKLLDEVK